jgi:uncharacterized protein
MHHPTTRTLIPHAVARSCRGLAQVCEYRMMSDSPRTQPGPGWYHDGTAMRWWDGTAWGPVAPPGSFGRQQPVDPVRDGSTLAVLSHVGFFVGGFVLPLIFRLTEGKKNEYVRHHSTEALNFQITLTIGWIVGFGVLVVSSLTMSTIDGGLAPFLVFPFFGMFALFIGGAVLAVIGAIRASRGEWWRYPVNLRLVSGARPPG